MIRSLFLGLLACVSLSFSATVINDDFAADNGDWNPIYGTYEITGGKLRLVSTPTSGLLWINRPATEIKDFTLEVDIDIESFGDNSQVGIAFRTQSSPADAYWFLLDPHGFFMLKKNINGVQTGFTQFLVSHSFVFSDLNALRITADADTMLFWVNGQLAYRMEDATLSTAGKIGLLAVGSTTVSFDNLMVKDDLSKGPGLTYFSSNFSSATQKGWKSVSDSGGYQIVDGQMQGTGGGTFFATLVTDGNYGEMDTVYVKTERTGGASATSTFGLLYHYSQSETATLGYLFCIVNGAAFTVLKMDQGSIAPLFAPVISSDITNSVNTFKVVNHGAGKTDLYLNGKMVKTITDNAFPSGGSGFVVDKDLVVGFDDFFIGAKNHQNIGIEEKKVTLANQKFSALHVAPNPIHTTARFRFALKPEGVQPVLKIFDLRGRLLGALHPISGGTGEDFFWNALTAPAGIYIARIKTDRGFASKRIAVIK